MFEKDDVLTGRGCGLRYLFLSPPSRRAIGKGEKGKTVTITGCVQKGDEADEFAITQNGKKYGLKSTNVKLADHLGHQVTVTGKITRGPGQSEEGEKEEQGREHADVHVTSLKMISTTCQ
jgi:hypothetical protein